MGKCKYERRTSRVGNTVKRSKGNMVERVDREKFRIAFSTKKDGNMSLGYGEEKLVHNNRKKFFGELGLHEEEILFISPKHSNAVSLGVEKNEITIYTSPPAVEGDFEGFKNGIDGHLTTSEYPVGVMTGDCVPLIIYHERSNLHGIIHIGLLGVVNNTIKNLENICNDLNIDPFELGFYMGPSIKQKSYDLKYSTLWSGIKERVEKNAQFIKEFIKVTDNSIKVDLQAAIGSQLLSIGADPNKIEISSEDTGDTNSKYYSHYISRITGIPEGRFLSVIYIG